MQQSSATQSLHLSLWGLRKIVACCHSSLQCLLVSTVFGTVSSLHPTSFLMIFTLVHVVLQWGNKGGEGKGKWVRIICAYSGCCLCLKKEARQVNQKFFEF